MGTGMSRLRTGGGRPHTAFDIPLRKHTRLRAAGIQDSCEEKTWPTRPKGGGICVCEGGTGQCRLGHVDLKMQMRTAFAAAPFPHTEKQQGVCSGKICMRIVKVDRRCCCGWLTSRRGGGHFGTAATGADGGQGQRHIQPDMREDYGNAFGVSFVQTIKRGAGRLGAGKIFRAGLRRAGAAGASLPAWGGSAG